MTDYGKNWLDKELKHWVDKGWITKDAQQHIRSKYGVKKSGRLPVSLPLYLIMSVIGLAVVVLALVWAAAFGWYHINVSIKLAIAVILLVLSQMAVGTVLFQEREGTLLSEGIGLVHCAIVFISMALVEQAFYTGWNMVMYILACSLLILPSAYLLRSIGMLIAFYVASMAWAAMPGSINVPGGISLLWGMLILTVPFYALLVREKSEFRLAVFSWIITIGVFGAFAFSVRSAGYVPFLMLSALSVVMLLTGFSIDIRKAWGVPFRWFGRLAAAGALLFSCMQSSWLKIVQGNDIHWLSIIITAVLMMLMVVIYVKWLKNRLWTPTIYGVIPVLLAIESLLVHNGPFVSAAMLLSICYMLLLGIFEISYGVRNNMSTHIKWGVVIIFALAISFFMGSQISPVIPVAAILILAFMVWKFTQTSKRRSLHMLQKARKAKQHHAHQTVSVAPAEEVKMPVPPRTVVTKPVQESLFVPPVFHEPEDMPLVQQTAKPMSKQPAVQPAPAAPAEHRSSSPWSDMPERPKREKHFTRSPWSQEGESKK